MKTIPILFALFALFFGCRPEKKDLATKTIETDGISPLNPRLKLDRDTFLLGDSITGVIGVVFKKNITQKHRNEVIGSLSYRIIHEAETMKNDKFHRHHRLNDSTFRFAFLPTKIQVDSIQKLEFEASIYIKSSSTEKGVENEFDEREFLQRFEYFIKR